MTLLEKYVMQMEEVGLCNAQILHLEHDIKEIQAFVNSYAQELKQLLENKECSLEDRSSMAQNYVEAVDKLRRNQEALSKAKKRYTQFIVARKTGVAGDPFMAASSHKEQYIGRNFSLDDLMGIPVDNKV